MLLWTSASYAQEEGSALGEPMEAVVHPAAEVQADDDAGAELQEVDEETGDRVPPGQPVRGRREAAMRGARNRNVVLLEAFREEVKRVLQPDEETAGLIEEIFAEHIEEAKTSNEHSAEDRREQASEIRDLVAELREAQREGDTDRMVALRERITDLRRSTQEEQGTVALDELEDQMHEVLAAEQFELFEKIARKYEPRFLRSNNTSEQTLLRMRSALAAVNLDPEQRTITRRLLVEHGRKIRQVRNNEDKATEEVQALRDAITNELDPDQADAFEQRLAELDRQQGVNPGVHARGRTELDRGGIDEGADDEAGVETDEEHGGEEPLPPEER
jgi:hypothetical protein